MSEWKSVSRVRLIATPWIVAHQASLSMGFSRQEYWSGLPFPSPGDLPEPGIEPRSPALQADSLLSEPQGKQINLHKFTCSIQFSSVQLLSCVLLLWPHGLQHARLPHPSPTPGAYSNSYPSHQWCHSTISSSVIPFSSHLQSFLASGSFPMSRFFPSGAQSIGVSASASVLPMNIQDWFPLGWTGWISLQSKGLKNLLQHHSSNVNTTVYML